jgi:hypothetical protein
VHEGSPKFWYGVDIDCNAKFEKFVQNKFPEYFKDCPEYIRHKTTLIYPGLLIANGIKLTKVIHNPGEFMITRAAAYHSGFNFGFNVAEAVNFALTNWLQIAPYVKCCNCSDSTVRINMANFEENMKTVKYSTKKQCYNYETKKGLASIINED